MPKNRTHQIFITGGSGYLGRPLISRLLQRGHEVRVLVRAGSEHKLPAGCTPILGNAIDHDSYIDHVRPADTFVQLVGVSHPNPTKAEEFRRIDLVSVQAAISAAQASGIHNFVYVSVAQPAPVMQAYVQTRAECEALIRASGLHATFVRPWYVLGPGHRWPYLLLPMYWLFEHLPGTRNTARRLGLVTLEQMINTLAWAVENPSQSIRIIEVSEIRQEKGI